MLFRSKQNISLMFSLLLDFSRNPSIIVVSLLLFLFFPPSQNRIILKKVEKYGEFCKLKKKKNRVQ